MILLKIKKIVRLRLVFLNVQKTYFWSQETPCSVVMLVPLWSPWSIKGSGMPSRTYSLGSHLQFRETEHDQWSLTTLSHAFIISKTGVTILFVTLWPRVSLVNQGHAKRIKPSVLRSCTKHCQQQHTKHCRWASSVQELSSCCYCLFGGGLFISAYHCLCRVIYIHLML